MQPYLLHRGQILNTEIILITFLIFLSKRKSEQNKTEPKPTKQNPTHWAKATTKEALSTGNAEAKFWAKLLQFSG